MNCAEKLSEPAIFFNFYPLSAFNYKTLFDIATCTFLKRQTKFEAEPFGLNVFYFSISN